MSAIDKLIQIAENEVGYLEKRSNSQLYNKTANAGSGNYTKYWAEIKPKRSRATLVCLFRNLVFRAGIREGYGRKALKTLSGMVTFVLQWQVYSHLTQIRSEAI